MANGSEEKLTLVARKPYFGLPTACPHCLPVYFYLKFARVPFDLCFNANYPDFDQIPYVESGSYVAYKSGVIEGLKEDGIVDLDSSVQTIPEWVAMKAMVESWLKEAVLYELWLGAEGNSAQKIYYSDLPWPIGKELQYKQVFEVMRFLGITKENADKRETEIYGRADAAYKALSTLLGDESFFYGERSSSLDAVFLGQALFTMQALPETSVLKSKLLQFNNLVKYTEKHSKELVDIDSSSSSAPLPKRLNLKNSKPKRKPKKERSEVEKMFRRRGKYFLATLAVAVLVFLTLLSSDEAEIDLDNDDGSYEYAD